jgi:hypothetical protein
MKLRFKGNTLRLRLNRSEVMRLAAGSAIEEEVVFPGSAKLSYVLRPTEAGSSATFDAGVITISAPRHEFQSWSASDEIGLYFDLSTLKIAIEKDLECLDGPRSERDPDAFPRSAALPCR